MDPSPPASDPPQALETGQDDLSRAVRPGPTRARGREGRCQRPELVAQLGSSYQCRLPHPLLRRAGRPPARRVTSTLRTARCGPACRVVWQGSPEIIRGPYADFGVLHDGDLYVAARFGELPGRSP